MDLTFPFIDWGTHLDYGWFLAAVCWAGVLAGTASRRHWGSAAPWLSAFAACNLAMAVVEILSVVTWQLFVSAQDGSTWTQRMVWDLILGALPFWATLFLALAGLGSTRRWLQWPRALRLGLTGAGMLLALGLGSWRFEQPVLAGTVGGVLAAVVALAVVLGRASRRIGLGAWGDAALLLWVLLLAVATTGPVAFLLGGGRRFHEMAPYTLVTQFVALAGAIVMALAVWRGRLGADRSETGWANARSAFWLLAAWFAVGYVFVQWSARRTRLDYETTLLQRARTIEALLDRAALAEVLGPGFQLAEIKERPRGIGGHLTYSRVASVISPASALLRGQLRRAVEANNDIWDVSLLVPRDGWLAMPVKWPDDPEFYTEVIVTRPSADWAVRWEQTPEGFVLPPRNEGWGNVVRAMTPIRDRSRTQVIGWLDVELFTTKWAGAFSLARLQAMGVLLAGMLLWATGVRLRLRRTEQARAEAAATTAREADRAKGILLANVSHELRTPLQNILGYSELLEPEVTGAAGRARLDLVRQQVRLMSRLVNDLLDLSALESGTFRFAPEPTDLRRVVEAVVEAQRPRAEAKGLALQLVVDPALPAWLLVDPARLHQIATNLVGNAVKYTPGGRVEVVLLGLGGGRYELSVADTGPGIPAEEQRELFRPFSRLARPGHPEGSGLGLALSAALCRLAGGSIAIESDGRTGSRFRASFTAGTVAAPVAAPVQPAGSLAGRRVLVADDNPHVRELFAASLAQAGVQCDQVPDGGQAIARARAGNYDAAVIDLAMPVCNGFEVARRLRAEPPPGPRLRLVAVSAHAGNAEREQALAGGFDVFLVKPVEAAVLAAALAVPVATPPREVSAALRAAFAAELPALAAELAGLVTAADWPALRARAHYTKSSAAVLGYDPLFDALGRLEDAAAAGDAAGVADAWAACAPLLRAGQ